MRAVQDSNDLKPMSEQRTYASILMVGVWIGIVMLSATYLLYIAGVMPPHVDIAVVTQNWDKGVDQYLESTHSPHGWGWCGLLGSGDFLNYVGLALLALLTIVCYFALVAGYGKRRDWTYTVLCALEVLVLALAASGILGAGGH